MTTDVHMRELQARQAPRKVEIRSDLVDQALDLICEQMGRTPPWISGLFLRADGYECNFYKKD